MDLVLRSYLEGCRNVIFFFFSFDLEKNSKFILAFAHHVMDLKTIQRIEINYLRARLMD